MHTKDISKRYPLIVYDGYCMLCDRVILFVLQADKKERFRFCTLEYFQSMYPDQANQDRVMFLYGQKMSFGSDAAIDILQELGGMYRVLSIVMSLLPHFLREFVYQFIAVRRYTWFGKSHACILPPKSWQSRFLDNKL